MSSAPLRVLIMTALEVEYEAVRAKLGNCQRCSDDGIEEEGTYTANGRTWQVGIAQIGRGNVMSASATNSAIKSFKPKVALFVGIAGGVKDALIGDVVAASEVQWYEAGKAESEVFKSRPTSYKSSPSLIGEAKFQVRNWNRENRDQQQALGKTRKIPKYFLEVIASGEQVITSSNSQTYEFLRQAYNQAVAVETGGYGFMGATNDHRREIVVMVIRGISDLLENKNADQSDGVDQESEETRQQRASENASLFAFQLLGNVEFATSIISNPSSSEQASDSVIEELFDCFSCFDSSSAAKIVALSGQKAFDNTLDAKRKDLYPALQLLYAVNDMHDLEYLFSEIKGNLPVATAVDWGVRVLTHQEELSADVSRLQEWHDRYRPLSPKNKGKTDDTEGKPDYILLILEPFDDCDNVLLTAELHSYGSKVPANLLPHGWMCNLKQPDGKLREYLTKILRRCENVSNIEVFLSYQHLHYPVHEWSVDVTNDGRTLPLKQYNYNTLIRSLDRINPEKYSSYVMDRNLERLKKKLTQLRKCPEDQIDNVCYLVKETEQIERIENDILQGSGSERYQILNLLSELPKDKQELDNLVFKAIQSSIPLWFWFYSRPKNVEELTAAIKDLLRSQSLRTSANFANALYLNRDRLPDLGVLFDNAERLPIWADMFNVHLYQPKV